MGKTHCLRPGLDRLKKAWEDRRLEYFCQFTRCSRTMAHVLACKVLPPLFLDDYKTCYLLAWLDIPFILVSLLQHKNLSLPGLL